MLGCIRTSIALIMLGLGIVKLFPGDTRLILVGMSVGIGCIILMFGGVSILAGETGD